MILLGFSGSRAKRTATRSADHKRRSTETLSADEWQRRPPTLSSDKLREFLRSGSKLSHAASPVVMSSRPGWRRGIAAFALFESQADACGFDRVILGLEQPWAGCWRTGLRLHPL